MDGVQGPKDQYICTTSKEVVYIVKDKGSCIIWDFPKQQYLQNKIVPLLETLILQCFKSILPVGK